MRNLWVAGRALTSACTYLAHMKPVLDGSPGRGMRARLGPARPVTVPVDPGKGHRVHNTRPRTCPRSRDTRSAPRRPAGAHREARDRAGSRSARPGCGLGTPRAPPEAAAAPPAAQNNARPPRHSPLTWPCRLPAGAPTARGIVGSRLRDARHGKGNWPGPGHGSMASARTRRAAARDCGMSPCSLLSPRAGFRRCAAPPPRQPRQEGARTRRAPTRSPGPRPPARPGPRRSPPLQLLGLRAQPARPARLDGRLESAAWPAAAEATHRLEAGRRRAGKKLHGCWWVSFSVISAHSFGVLREN